jgi:hypothetical protein
MTHDPQWAVRWLKRVLKLAAALLLLLVVLAITWHLLPQGPAEIELALTTNSPASLAGRELGTGEIVLDDAALRAGGAVFPAGTDLSDMAARLFPSEEFRGPLMVDAHSLPRETDGFECELHNAGNWRIARVWVFAIEDDQYLAVPIQFRDSAGRVHTACPESRGSMGWSVTRSFAKRRSHKVSATVRTTEGTFLDEGEVRIGSMKIR